MTRLFDGPPPGNGQMTDAEFIAANVVALIRYERWPVLVAAAEGARWHCLSKVGR